MPPTNKNAGPDDAFREALAHHQAGRLDQAGSLYARVLEAEPRNADALHLMGVVAQQQGQPARAIELIEKAIAIAPREGLYRINIAQAYRTAGNLERAHFHASQAVEIQPGKPEAHNNLGLALESLDRAGDALAHFERAIELNPFLPVPYDNAARILCAQGRHHEAAGLVREGVRLSPGNPLLVAALERIAGLIAREAADA